MSDDPHKEELADAPTPATEDAAVELWVSASLSSSFDHVLAEAIPAELLALAGGLSEPG